MAKTESTITIARASTFDPASESVRDGDWLAHGAANDAYRRLRRYLRRHVAPHADSHIRRLLRLDDQQRAARIAASPNALAAWSVAIWTFDLEVRAHARLWDDRPVASWFKPGVMLVLKRRAMGMELAVKTATGLLHADQAAWLLEHAALATLRRRFFMARAMAQGMSRAEDATLADARLGANRLGLTAEVLDNGDLRFTVEVEALRDVLSPRHHTTKDERRVALDEALVQRRTALSRFCVGACLRFSWRDGWCADSSSAPDLASDVGIKRHRLFVPGRPAFVLFRFEDGWCARLIDMPLEVRDIEPWRTIDTLRYAYRKYTALNGAPTADAKRATAFQAPSPAFPAPNMTTLFPT